MTTYEVRPGGQGEGGTLPTIAAAARLVKAGDTVILRGGVYRERLIANVAGVTWQAADGERVVLDGGWNGKTLTKLPTQVVVTAADVTVDGLSVVNVAGDAIGVSKGGHQARILNCRVDKALSGGIILNAGETLRGIVVSGCVVTRTGMGWAIRRSGGVSGAINLIRCDGALVEDTVSAYSWGEGLNVGKGTTNSVVRRYTGFDNAHFCLGVNRAQDCLIEECLLFLTGFEERQVGSENWPGGLVIGDEEGLKGETYAPSRGIQVRRNVIINAGIGIGVRNDTTWDGYDTQLVDTAIEFNTVVFGPLTRVGINVGENERGRPHVNSVVRDNAVWSSSAAWPGWAAASGDTENVTWTRNGWSNVPLDAFRSFEDVIGFELVDPAAPLANEFPVPAHNVNLGNYRPVALSPLIGAGTNGSTIGALAAQSGPPVEPPLEPDTAPDVAAAVARLATALMQLEAIAAAGNVAAEAWAIIREQAAIMALAQQDAADNVAAAVAILEG